MDTYDPDIVTVVDEDGKEHQFEVLDRIEDDDDKKYIAMIPVFEGTDEMLEDSGELIILRVMEENGETYLEPIEDEEEFNRIGGVFEERLSEMFEFDDDEDEEEE